VSRSLRRRRGQSLVETALIAPILITVLLCVVDFGRAAYDYSSLSAAAREGARVAIRTGSARPANADVVAAVQQNAIGLSVSAGPCLNGYTSGVLTAPSAPNTGYVYIVPGTTGQTVNAPGGQAPAVAAGSCVAVTPADAAIYPLSVTIVYTFQPLTPLAQQFLGNSLVMTVTSTMNTEY
jgi:Flp pilus assembly protein TadG